MQFVRLPLIYCLGAADGDKAQVFNNVCNLGSMAMTGFSEKRDWCFFCVSVGAQKKTCKRLN